MGTLTCSDNSRRLNTSDRHGRLEEVMKYLVRPPGDEVPQLDVDDSHDSLLSSPNNAYAKRRRFSNSEGINSYVYEPSLERIQEATARQLPHFLYRVTHENSGGTNSEGEYLSQARKGGLGRADFSTFSHEQINEDLLKHERGNHFPSHWISFTDSPITAIGRATRCHQRGCKNVCVHIIDLMTLKAPTLIVHAYAALRGYRSCTFINPFERKKTYGGSYAEFLVWDELRAEACAVGIEELLQAGLRERIPQLRRIQKDIYDRPEYKAPCELRNQLTISSRRVLHERHDYEQERRRIVANKNQAPWKDRRFPMEPHIMAGYYKVAECFERPKFQLVFLVAMLAMSTKHYEQDSMVEMLIKVVKEDKAMANHLTFYTTNMRTSHKEDVEVFQEIFGELVAAFSGKVRSVQEMPNRQLVSLATAYRKAYAVDDPEDEEGTTEWSALTKQQHLRPVFSEKRKRRMEAQAVAANAKRSKKKHRQQTSTHKGTGDHSSTQCDISTQPLPCKQPLQSAKKSNKSIIAFQHRAEKKSGLESEVMAKTTAVKQIPSMALSFAGVEKKV